MREEEIRIKGVTLSDGIAIGTPYLFHSSQEEVPPQFPIAIGEVDQEIARYRKALFSSKEDLESLQNSLEKEGSLDAVTIIDAHIEMLKDPLMTTHVEEKIRQMKQNTEAVFRSVMTEYENKFFAKTSDMFFQERLNDVLDLSKRILRNLDGKQKKPFFEIPDHSIIIAKILTPTETASLQADRSFGFITEKGGTNSHTALIARGKGIPFISQVDLSIFERMKKQIIVDGASGFVIVNPSLKTLSTYQKMKEKASSEVIALQQETYLQAETKDGFSVNLFANIGSACDVDLMHQFGGEGVGLFRTEYLFSGRDSLFSSEEEQSAIYSSVLKKAKGLPVVFRVFDVGADKYSHLFEELVAEGSPLTGVRGIRFLLQKRGLFKIQLRAIMRSASFGDARILLPFVSDTRELLLTKHLIEEARAELFREGVMVKESIPLGAMIELPAAVMMCDSISRECDFLSIGTNDLIQYTLGIDRSSNKTEDPFHPIHPGILRMVHRVLEVAKLELKPVTLCGEVASDPLLTSLLLGLGVTNFSCAPRFIPSIKKAIRSSTYAEAQALAEQALKQPTAEAIATLLS